MTLSWPLVLWVVCVLLVGGGLLLFAYYRNRFARADAQLKSRARALEAENTELRQDHSHVMAVLQGMTEGVLVCDVQRTITLVNPVASLMLDLPASAIGQHIDQCVTHVGLREAMNAVLLHGEMRTQELESGADDDIREWIAHCAPVHEASGRMSVVVVLSDVTRTRRLERVRKEFVANVSHELKTPLTSIRGYAETLLEGGLHDTQAAPGFVEKIAANALQLQVLVEDILSLAAIESGQLTLQRQRCALRECIDELCRQYHLADAQCCVDCAPDYHVWADPQALRQMLGNLIENAKKYAGPKLQLHIAVEQRGGSDCISVSDNGPGIPASEQSRIFARFYRVDKSRATKMGSSGLGLAIVKTLVRAHGGEVGVSSACGHGATFTLRLPQQAGVGE